jgi:DNA-binding HxlR family transcriptional regulator
METTVTDCSFAKGHPGRELFDQVLDKWSLMTLGALASEPLRFNALKRRLEGVTQKALTQCLRRLERNGLVTRHVIPVSPVAVEYRITELGRTLLDPFRGLYAWVMVSLPAIEGARQDYDRRQAGSPA